MMAQILLWLQRLPITDDRSRVGIDLKILPGGVNGLTLKVVGVALRTALGSLLLGLLSILQFLIVENIALSEIWLDLFVIHLARIDTLKQKLLALMLDTASIDLSICKGTHLLFIVLHHFSVVLRHYLGHQFMILPPWARMPIYILSKVLERSMLDHVYTSHLSLEQVLVIG